MEEEALILYKPSIIYGGMTLSVKQVFYFKARRKFKTQTLGKMKHSPLMLGNYIGSKNKIYFIIVDSKKWKVLQNCYFVVLTDKTFFWGSILWIFVSIWFYSFKKNGNTKVWNQNKKVLNQELIFIFFFSLSNLIIIKLRKHFWYVIQIAYSHYMEKRNKFPMPTSIFF